MNFNLIEDAKVVNLQPPKDISSSAFAAAYVKLDHYGRVDFIINTGVNGVSSASVAVTFTQATNTSGSSSAAIPVVFYHKNSTALGSASVANDTFAKTSVASSAATFNLHASATANVQYVVGFDAEELTDGKNSIGIAIAKTAAATLMNVTAILTNPRYRSAAATTKTAI